MRILFANNIRGYFGGVEQVIYDTARGLRERGHVSLLAHRSNERNVDAFSESFEACFQCSEFAPGGVDGMPFSSIVEAAKPDVIYFHKVTQLPPFDSFLGKIRSVRMVHDHDLYCPTSYKYFRTGKKICHYRAGWRCWLDAAFLAKNPNSVTKLSFVNISAKIAEMRRSHNLDAILAVSSFIQDGLVMNGFPKEKVHIVHPILPLSDPPYTPVPKAPRILFVGQLIRGKGLDLLFNVLTRLKCDYLLTVIGTGNSRDKLHAMCRDMGLNDRVEFLDWVDHAEIGSYYENARVVVAPSRWPEPFTLIGQEAMRRGRPVVAFDVGGNGNWLEHDLTGLLAPEQDFDAFAAALESVLTDDERAERLGKQAYARVRERFSFQKYLDEIEARLSGNSLNCS
jgi:glycosyltransferase involved in cell wall biosynthesis